MHSASFDLEGGNVDGGDVLVAIAALVTEGRTPRAADKTCHGFYEGPHCYLSRASLGHRCDMSDAFCLKYNNVRSQVLGYWEKFIPICIEVLLQPHCSSCGKVEGSITAKLLEQWYLKSGQKRSHGDPTAGVPFNVNQLIGAIRSQLHFSQLSAWLSKDSNTTATGITFSIIYRLTVPGETYEACKFSSAAQSHHFPVVELSQGVTISISLLTLPRTQDIPHQNLCSNCQKALSNSNQTIQTRLFDDRMHTLCTLKGKHRCDEEMFQENGFENPSTSKTSKFNSKLSKLNQNCGDCRKTNSADSSLPSPSTSSGFSLPKQHKLHCTLKGKHRCEEEEEDEKVEFGSAEGSPRRKPQLRLDISKAQASSASSLDLELSTEELNEVLCVLQQPNHCRTSQTQQKNNDLTATTTAMAATTRSRSKSKERTLLLLSKKKKEQEEDESSLQQHQQQRKGDILLDAILRSCSKSKNCSSSELHTTRRSTCDTNLMNDSSDIKSSIKDNIYVDVKCDRTRSKRKINRKITFEEDCTETDGNLLSCCDDVTPSSTVCGSSSSTIPSALEQAKFRKNLDSAASMVFHSRTGLPLTSSPAPMRRGKSCFDFDSSINSVSAIRSALFSLATDDDSESDCSIVSPCSPDYSTSSTPSESLTIKYHRKGQAAHLLGSFEESVLNGRLEPDSTVHGFSAELGASGSFVPRHLVVPVTVFFYTLGDMSSPYLGHINLGKKGYNVPKSGTVQVTLFNPLRTVVKMFVIMYDLNDMPANSQTFIRQRTLYMPIDCREPNIEWGQKWLRYLIHLRFMSSKSGRIYLHSDIRMIIFRKSDLDTATAHGLDMSYELRSFTHMPSNPKYSPRK